MNGQETVFPTDKEFESAGFALISTGGGCTAWHKPLGNNANAYMLITCLDGCGHYLTDSDDKFIIACHWEDDGGNAAWSDCLEGASAQEAIKASEAARLAWEFAIELERDIGRVGLAKTVRVNKERADPFTCASHDYCDANMTMAEAYSRLFGQVEWIEEGHDESDTSGQDRWNLAWDFAKRNHFFTESN